LGTQRPDGLVITGFATPRGLGDLLHGIDKHRQPQPLAMASTPGRYLKLLAHFCLTCPSARFTNSAAEKPFPAAAAKKMHPV
jgi:hypothetical protein